MRDPGHQKKRKHRPFQGYIQHSSCLYLLVSEKEGLQKCARAEQSEGKGASE
jgi:hypothetical protein